MPARRSDARLRIVGPTEPRSARARSHCKRRRRFRRQAPRRSRDASAWTMHGARTLHLSTLRKLSGRTQGRLPTSHRVCAFVSSRISSSAALTTLAASLTTSFSRTQLRSDRIAELGYFWKTDLSMPPSFWISPPPIPARQNLFVSSKLFAVRRPNRRREQR